MKEEAHVGGEGCRFSLYLISNNPNKILEKLELGEEKKKGNKVENDERRKHEDCGGGEARSFLDMKRGRFLFGEIL